MDTSELIKKVRKIEIKTKGLSQQIFSGQYHSAFKGRGMAFSEVREYQYGDDIRSIDWNVTARFDRPYVKIFEEERELTVILMIDVSASNLFGTQSQFKQDLLTEIAAVLSYSAIHNNDKVGVIFFSDRVEKYISPKKGKTHILRIIRELLSITPINRGTRIDEALRFLNNVHKKRSTVFLMSDFYDHDYTDALKIVKKKHDLMALRVYDLRESELPNIGLIRICDRETGQERLIDTSSTSNRRSFAQAWAEHDHQTTNLLKRASVHHVSIRTDQDYIKPLTQLFQNR